MSTERPVSLIQELRLRQWARQNYVAPEFRLDAEWHSVVLDEMQRRDREIMDDRCDISDVWLTDVVPLEQSGSRHILRFDDRNATPQPVATTHLNPAKSRPGRAIV